MEWANRPCKPLSGRLSRAWRAAAACALLALPASPALAGPNDTGTAAGLAEIAVVSPLSLVKVHDMAFGRMAASTAAGTVVLNPADSTCTVTGPLIHVGGCRAAQFAGMGARRMIVRLNTPASITMTGPGGATMLIDTITRDTSPDLQAAANGNGNGNGGSNQNRFRIVSDSGIFAFTMGGTLRVSANQAPGVYTGTFDVTAAYQ